MSVFRRDFRSLAGKSSIDSPESEASEFDHLLIVELKSNHQAIGECKMSTPNSDGVATTDVKLLPETWGNGYGVEIKRGLLNHLFANTDCIAAEATPNVNNVASIRMQEAVGGIRVGENPTPFPKQCGAIPHRSTITSIESAGMTGSESEGLPDTQASAIPTISDILPDDHAHVHGHDHRPAVAGRPTDLPGRGSALSPRFLHL